MFIDPHFGRQDFQTLSFIFLALERLNGFYRTELLAEGMLTTN